MDEWHASIGSAIIEKWGFAEYVSGAIAHYSDLERDNGEEANYTDVLTIAYLLSQMMNSDADMEVQLDNIPASRHLQLTTAEIMPTLQESNRQINSLRRALGK